MTVVPPGRLCHRRKHRRFHLPKAKAVKVTMRRGWHVDAVEKISIVAGYGDGGGGVFCVGCDIDAMVVIKVLILSYLMSFLFFSANFSFCCLLFNRKEDRGN